VYNKLLTPPLTVKFIFKGSNMSCAVSEREAPEVFFRHSEVVNSPTASSEGTGGSAEDLSSVSSEVDPEDVDSGCLSIPTWLLDDEDPG
jgi:hypothetical protein